MLEFSLKRLVLKVLKFRFNKAKQIPFYKIFHLNYKCRPQYRFLEQLFIILTYKQLRICFKNENNSPHFAHFILNNLTIETERTNVRIVT